MTKCEKTFLHSFSITQFWRIFVPLCRNGAAIRKHTRKNDCQHLNMGSGDVKEQRGPGLSPARPSVVDGIPAKAVTKKKPHYNMQVGELTPDFDAATSNTCVK